MLATEIKNKFIDARKAQNKELKATYEQVVARMINEEKSGKYPVTMKELPDDAVQGLIIKIIKELKETQSYYKPEQEQFIVLENQVKELSQYLPKELSEDEVITIIKKIVDSGESNQGKIIGATIKEVGNSFDKSKIAGLVNKILRG